MFYELKTQDARIDDMEPFKKQKMKTEMVILVDDNDNETGVAEKLEAHLSGQLHRAISVFIFNTAGQWLI